MGKIGNNMIVKVVEKEKKKVKTIIDVLINRIFCNLSVMTIYIIEQNFS
jgi:hypothetical protein